jgi:hypothetical protein
MRVKCPNCNHEYETRVCGGKYTANESLRLLYGALVEVEEFCALCKEPLIDCPVHTCPECEKRVCNFCWKGELCRECTDLTIPPERRRGWCPEDEGK